MNRYQSYMLLLLIVITNAPIDAMEHPDNPYRDYTAPSLLDQSMGSANQYDWRRYYMPDTAELERNPSYEINLLDPLCVSYIQQVVSDQEDQVHQEHAPSDAMRNSGRGYYALRVPTMPEQAYLQQEVPVRPVTTLHLPLALMRTGDEQILDEFPLSEQYSAYQATTSSSGENYSAHEIVKEEMIKGRIVRYIHYLEDPPNKFFRVTLRIASRNKNKRVQVVNANVHNY